MLVPFAAKFRHVDRLSGRSAGPKRFKRKVVWSKNKIPAATGQFAAGVRGQFLPSLASLSLQLLPRARSLSPSLSRLSLRPRLQGVLVGILAMEGSFGTIRKGMTNLPSLGAVSRAMVVKPKNLSRLSVPWHNLTIFVVYGAICVENMWITSSSTHVHCQFPCWSEDISTRKVCSFSIVIGRS